MKPGKVLLYFHVVIEMDIINTVYFISHHYESAGILHIQREHFSFTVLGARFAQMKTWMP